MAKDPAQGDNPYPYRVTQAIRKAFTLNSASPASLAQRFVGYLNHADPTTIPINALTYPSQNGFIPMKDKFVPRLGSTLLGQAYTANKNWPIIGHKKRFTTAGGFSLEVRVTQSDDPNLQDIIEVLYPNPTTGVLQWYTISTGVWQPTLRTLSPWNAISPGVHRYYMDDWFDTNLNPSESLNASRLIWVNGLSYAFSWLGGIAPIVSVDGTPASAPWFLTVAFGTIAYRVLFPGSYTVGESVFGSISGASGIVVVSGIVVGGHETMTIRNISATPFLAGESLTGSTSGYATTIIYYTPPANTWASLGFLDPTISGESSFININGIGYTVISGWNTDTLTMAITAGAIPNVGDVAFSYPRADATPVPMDVCRQNQNYMFYGYWKSRRLFMSNAFSHDATATITNAQSSLDNLLVSGSFNSTGFNTYTILVTGTGTPDTYQWSYNGAAPTTGVSMTNTAHLLSNGISVTFPETTGHTIGDTWTISVNQAVTNAWINFYYSTPARLPGEGYIYQLPSNFWAMEPQEDVMYINTDYGEWGTVQSTIAANLLTETVTYTPLKHAAASKVIFPYMISHMDNSLIFVTNNKKLDMIQRMKFLELPQIGNLSNPVQNDFEASSFDTGSSMEYHDKKLWINSAPEGRMLCYDELQKYWQPPQVIPENGILSVVENTLISHSNLRDQTFTLFNSNTQGDNGNNYEVIMRTGYDSGGDRYGKKASNTSFVEGYVSGNPTMNMNLFIDINGSTGIRSHVINPITVESQDAAPIGEGYLGETQLGSDLYNPYPHFYEIDRNSLPIIMNYRFLQYELNCTAKEHSYSWLNIGVNRVVSTIGNNDITDTPEISPN